MPKKKEKEKKGKRASEISGSEITRRTMLKISAAAGAGTVLAPIVLTSRKSTVFAQDTVAEPVLCAPTPTPASPPTTPFVDMLPVPNTAVPKVLNPTPTKAANVAGGEAPRADHQRWDEFLPAVNYRMEARAAEHQFHSDLLPSYVWAFNGKYPAETPINRYGDATLVRFKNSLPSPTTSFGTPEITIHLHNGHTASESDGFAGDFFQTGFFKDNHYANRYAGIDTFGGLGDPREKMGTFWFHDHRAAETANSNYLGLNGMYIAYDATDPGHEFATEGSLQLPGIYGKTDIPLILTEKRFCATPTNGRNELFQVVGAGAPAGDKWSVNGKIQPKMHVRRRKYRFRILNTGPVKTFNLSLIGSDGLQKPWTVVATDANFLEHPFDLTNRTLDVFVASRFDVIVDFAQFPVGSSVYIKENQAQNVGVATPNPAPGLVIGNVLMRFDVIGNAVIPDTPPIPATLCQMPDPLVPDASFEWTFKLNAGQFQINDLPFDANRVDHVVLKGTTEEWTLRNNVLAGNWLHPVHIHFEEGRIQSRTTRPDPINNPGLNVPVPLLPEELGRRDVYPLPPQNVVVLRMRFRDFVGRYLIHCHNMNHEDNFMMVRWDIVETLAELRTRRQEIAQYREKMGLPPIYKREDLV